MTNPWGTLQFLDDFFCLIPDGTLCSMVWTLLVARSPRHWFRCHYIYGGATEQKWGEEEATGGGGSPPNPSPPFTFLPPPPSGGGDGSRVRAVKRYVCISIQKNVKYFLYLFLHFLVREKEDGNLIFS